MNFILVLFLLCLVKDIRNVPVPAGPTTAQAYLNNAQNYANSMNAGKVKVPTVSTPVGNTVIKKPPSLPKGPTTATTKAPVTTITKTPLTTTTNAPIIISTTKAPEIITTKTSEIITTNASETTTTSVLPETVTTTNLPATAITLPCTTTNIPVTTATLQAVTETTTCEPNATITPTSGVTVTSERLNELMTKLLNLLGEFVKITDCSETNNLLTQLIRKLTGEVDVLRTSATSSTEIGENNNDLSSVIENRNTRTTSTDVIVPRDQIEVTVIRIQDLIKQSTTTAACEEINKVITEVVNILTGGRGTLTASNAGNTVGDNTAEDRRHLCEERETSIGETDTFDGETDTSDGETDTSNGEANTSNGKTNTYDGKTGTSNGEADTFNGETATLNITPQYIQAESPNEGSTPSKDPGKTSLNNDSNGSIDEVTSPRISQLIYALKDQGKPSDSNSTDTTTTTIVGMEQIKELIGLLTNVEHIGSTKQLMQDFINQLTPGSVDDTDGTSESSGNDVAATITIADKTASTDQINLIASQSLNLNNEPRTTAVNQQIKEVISEVEGQVMGNDGNEAIQRLTSDIKSPQTQPISAKTDTQMKQLLDESISQVSGENDDIGNTNGTDTTDSGNIANTSSNTTTFDEILAQFNHRRELRIARRKEAAAIRAQKLAAIKAQRKNQQRRSQTGLSTSGTDEQVLPKADVTEDIKSNFTKLNQLFSGLFS